MTRKDFMKEARLTAHRILESKENGIMNLVQQAWAEGKRNAEVETLREAIDEALDRREPKPHTVDAIYPTWKEWLISSGFVKVTEKYGVQTTNFEWDKPIPANIAEKLGIAPKEDV